MFVQGKLMRLHGKFVLILAQAWGEVLARLKFSLQFPGEG
jgi:hypothetical protein